MADKGKGTTPQGSPSRKRSGDGDNRSGNRKKINTSILDCFDDDVEVEEENESSDEDFFNNDEINCVSVKTATGKTISLVVKGSDTIGSIKVKIQAEQKIKGSHG